MQCLKRVELQFGDDSNVNVYALDEPTDFSGYE
jgi:hypothetical protein